MTDDTTGFNERAARAMGYEIESQLEDETLYIKPGFLFGPELYRDDFAELWEVLRKRDDWETFLSKLRDKIERVLRDEFGHLVQETDWLLFAILHHPELVRATHAVMRKMEIGNEPPPQPAETP